MGGLRRDGASCPTETDERRHYAGRSPMPDTISSTKQERPYILLVAEENALRRSLQLTLRARGYEVRAFASGAHALAEPSALQATCLITDHHMAEMTGEDLDLKSTRLNSSH